MALKDFGNSLAAAQVKVEVVQSAGALVPAELEDVSYADPAWHSTIKSVGNPYDSYGGYKNFVAYVNSSPFPITWYRAIGDTLIPGPVIASGGAFACFALNNSLNALQYAWTDAQVRACWGRHGRVLYYDFGANQQVVSLSDDAESVYAVTHSGTDGRRVTKLSFESLEADVGTPILAERIAYANHTLPSNDVALAVWKGKAVVFYRDVSSFDKILF
jgi:hypothetical protein